MSDFTFRYNNPGELEATLTATLPMKEWSKIKKALYDARGMEHHFMGTLGSIIEKAEDTFYADYERKEYSTVKVEE